MKEIVAKNQVDLGSARCIQLALSGMMFRLFRSMITVAILGLAVAFLAHMLAYSVMSGETSRRVWLNLEAERALGVRLRRLESPDPVATILAHWQRGDEARTSEHRRWASLGDDEVGEALRVAAIVARFERTLGGLNPRQQAVLAGDRTPLELLDALGEASAREAFFTRLRQLEMEVPLGDAAALETLATEEWPWLQALLGRARAGHQLAVAELHEALAPRGVTGTLVESPDLVARGAETAGFTTEGIDFERLAAFARDARVQRAIEESLSSLVIRRAVARALNLAPAETHSARLFAWLAENPANAAEFDAMLAEADAVEPLGTENLHRVAGQFLHHRRLQSLVPEAPDLEAAERLFGLDESSRWLILLAFLVCVIGVANAMLMSVTERFTEIATMKCLGAMDKFVMLMFVFEAAIQGLVGGVFGALLGILLAWVRGASEFGATLVMWDVLGTVFAAAFSALVVGVLLAVLAAVGPSLVAARLAPMEAMRVE